MAWVAPQLGDLRTEVRERTENENSLFVTDSEVNKYINKAWLNYYTLVVSSGGNRFNQRDTTHTLNGTAKYALPSDFYVLQKAMVIDSSFGLSLEKMSPDDEYIYRTGSNASTGPGRYFLEGTDIYVYPLGLSGSLELIYVPMPTKMVADTDTIGVNAGPWAEEYIVISASIPVLRKEESNVSELRSERQEITARIIDECSSRDKAPSSVRDVSSRFSSFEGYDISRGGY